jgi:hypothetical protein
MLYPVTIPALAGRFVAFDTGGLGKSTLVVDGTRYPSVKKTFTVPRPGQSPLAVKVKGRFFDPVPNLEVDGSIVEIAPALSWYQYAWCALPLILVALGGAIGGAIGGLAMGVNVSIFRSSNAALAKYALTALVAVAAVVGYIAIAGPIALMFNRP